MIVHGPKPSPFVRKVLVALEEKRLPYDTNMLVPEPKTPQLLAMNPIGKGPILELDDRTCIPDSSVICLYLERIRPQPSLYPEDPAAYARALFLEEYADTRLAEVAGGVLFERLVKPLVFQQEPDAARVRALLTDQLPPVLDYLEMQAPRDRETIGATLSIADVALGAHLGSLQLAGETIDSGRWPHLAAYVDGLWARPSFSRAWPQ